jgi:exodeoxyribonuclease III
MIIASYNANSIRARLPLLLRWLGENRPDVVCIQETKVVDADFPLDSFSCLGYSAVFRGEKTYNGVAILSAHGFDKAFYGFDGKGEDEGTRLLAAWVKGVPVVTTYIPQGTDPESGKFRYKLKFFHRLQGFFSEHFNPDEPLVWAGDFNVAPEHGDVYDPIGLHGQVGFHPDEHRALWAVKTWGFIDVFRRHNALSGQYTFWDYRIRNAVKNGSGWRIDHIWATRPAADLSTRAWIDTAPRLWDRPSDHTFLAAEFTL